ncbi:hypothetical protein HMH05_26865 [Pseudomonas sp. SbB1]|uniref:Uncharacterized protein n=2 Tax=Pseudomonas putida TaxID=303 RepID=B0KKA3_PSEPG|nr:MULTISPECIES: hypothetical protein [Pseudomonas]ABY96431.1 hypothetical protein PputGB1_0520 [Pseudomonas putida GB-1]MBP0711562.1 hypothetical protein [Pseudomonas sp. T34]MCK2191019.1 hypothetical protein [Pseudomonas sp. MB04B]NOG91418.1 hypothetical protein [Pseudomonas sp. SbB1]
MFRTHLKAEVKGAGAFGDGLRVWRYVEQAIQCPWLYVCCTEESGDVTLSSMLMIADMSAFEDVLSQQTERLRVENVLLVSPRHLNRHTGWLMEGLVECKRSMNPTFKALS